MCKIAETKLPYFSVTPTFSVCIEHGFIRGEAQECPDCGKRLRLTGRTQLLELRLSCHNCSYASPLLSREEIGELL